MAEKGCSASLGWGCGTFLIVIIILAIIGSMTEKNKDNLPIGKTRPLKEIALESVKVKNFKWYKSGFGTVMIADIIIENDSPYDIKDITIKCTHLSKSETVIDITGGKIYDIVKAGKTKKFNRVNLGFVHSQSASCNCKVTDLELYYGVDK